MHFWTGKSRRTQYKLCTTFAWLTEGKLAVLSVPVTWIVKGTWILTNLLIILVGLGGKILKTQLLWANEVAG
jgi:hypothetical protein